MNALMMRPQKRGEGRAYQEAAAEAPECSFLEEVQRYLKAHFCLFDTFTKNSLLSKKLRQRCLLVPLELYETLLPRLKERCVVRESGGGGGGFLLCPEKNGKEARE